MKEDAPKPRTPEEIEVEFDRAIYLLGGLHYFISETKGNSMDLDEIMEEVLNINRLFQKERIEGRNGELFLLKIEKLLEAMKWFAIDLGIKAEDVVMAKLEQYARMSDLEDKNLRKDFPEGLDRPN